MKPQTSGPAPLSYSVATAVSATGISETLIREAIRSGHLRCRKLNTKVVILAVDLLSWLESLPANRVTTNEKTSLPLT